MKFLITFLVTIILTSTVLFAREIMTIQSAPFYCEDARTLALAELKHECTSQNEELKEVIFEACIRHEVGDYVYDMEIHAFGVCN